MLTALEKYYLEKQRRENIEERDVLLAIAALIKTPEGKKLFRYLFKNLEVLNLPDKGMNEHILHEYLGFLRAGNSIYKLACRAASETASDIMAKIERERHEDEHEQQRIENGLHSTTGDEDN